MPDPNQVHFNRKENVSPWSTALSDWIGSIPIINLRKIAIPQNSVPLVLILNVSGTSRVARFVL